MKFKDFLAGILTGVAAGIAVREIIDRVIQMLRQIVLNTVKEAFKTEGPIDGSWIMMKTEPFSNNVITMDVYRGGISRIKNGEPEQFEFAADAKTGTVVELIKA